MKMSTEAYSELLEYGREKLNEGDYLKLANFLKSINDKKTESSTIHRILKEENITTIEFDTLKNKHYKIHIQKFEMTIYDGPRHNDEKVWYNLNGTDYVTDGNVFAKKMSKLKVILGMKNIKVTRHIHDDEPIEFKNFSEYRDYVNELEALEDIENDYCDLYYINHLFGTIITEWLL